MTSTRQSKFLTIIAMVSALALAGACGGGGSSSTNGDGDGGDGGSTNGGGVTTVSDTVPTDVVLSSPTAVVTSGTSLSKGLGLKADATSDYETKKEELDNLIAGEGECTFTLAKEFTAYPSCYGPQITYANHPDGPDQTPPMLPTGDLGVWNETQGESEACAAAKMNQLVADVAAYVDNMINIMGSMACAGKKAGISLPEVGGSVDLLSAMNEYVTVTGLTISSATLERLADDGTNPVYRSTINMTLAFGGDDTNTSKVVLKHIPTASDNSTYKGKLSYSYVITDVAQTPGNCSEVEGAEAGSMVAGTILYEKSSTTSVVYQMNYAEFCGTSTDPFDADNNIDPSDKASAANPDGWANNWNYGLFSIDPTTGLGTVAYAWQAGYHDGSTRVLDVTVSSGDDGSASGNAYFGYGPDIETAENRGSITQFFCNWAGPSADQGKVAEDLAQRQVLTRAAGTTVFSSDNENLAITYAPTNSCDSAGEGFTYQSDEGNMTNDNAAGSAVTNHLIGVGDIDFTMPTAPSDV